ncbi:hypothetical protein [Chitinophaga sp. HK235]|uniref:hypothetical protein n=1 Tax=Chitinophaga sp. HK235 TaxID=2952571 RepID=UPI001BA51873|nr:hypothetical protein [Chitinophaga sp. HK235]
MEKRWHLSLALLLLLFTSTKAQTVKTITMALPAQTLSITVLRPANDVYTYLSAPANFSEWAAGLCKSITPSAQPDTWNIVMANGNNATVRFTPYNAFRVLDHYVYPPSGQEVYMPMRVLDNGNSSEILLTVYRQPDMTDEVYASDLKTVKRDLEKLKTVLEQKTQ